LLLRRLEIFLIEIRYPLNTLVPQYMEGNYRASPAAAGDHPFALRTTWEVASSGKVQYGTEPV
jgi:hypothetical protein